MRRYKNNSKEDRTRNRHASQDCFNSHNNLSYTAASNLHNNDLGIKVFIEEVLNYIDIVPKPEKCFTIMSESQKNLNIECDSSEEACKLIAYIEMLLNKVRNE